MSEIAFFYGFITLFLFGVADALTAIPAKRMSPIAITLVIDVFIFVFFGIISIFLWDTYVWNTYVWLAIVGGTAGYFGFLCFVYSLTCGTVGVSAAIGNSYPILTALFGVIVLQEFLSPLQTAAILLTVFGVFGLSTKFSLADFKSSVVSRKSILLALCAMVLWGTQMIFMDTAVEHVSPFQVTHIVSITTLVVGLTLFILSKETFGSLIRERKSDLVTAASLGVFYFIGVLTFNSALKSGALGTTTAIAGAAPLVSAIFAYLFLREHLIKKEWFAVVLVVAGLIMLSIFN